MRDFEELRVRVRRIGAERYLVLANGMTQGVRAVRIGADASMLRDELNRLVDIETGNAPTGSTDTSRSLRRLGQSVHDLLFDDTLIACVRQARTAADQRKCGLRLRFDLPPELQPLPVEALCSPSDHPEQTFALDGNLSIVRSLRGRVSDHRLPTGADQPDVLRLLIAVASPNDNHLPRIDVDAELAELTELPDFVVHTDVIPNATRADIEKWLTDSADQPTAVLLIAHGNHPKDSDDGVVLLEARDGTSDPVPGHLLSGMLVRAPRLRLVVLNLCFGAANSAREPFAGLAQAMIGRGIPAVVAMHGLVTDRAASVFGPKLLAGVCANKPVDEAMTSARHHIANLPGHTTIEWTTPRLFLNADCAHGWLFKAREVREDDESTDPLYAGEVALHQFGAKGNIKPATAFAAARFLRLRQDWRRVEAIARAAPVTVEQQELITEARAEQAWPAVEEVCTALADADHVAARRHLDRVHDLLPSPVLRLLTGEIIAAEKVDDQLGQARKAAADADWRSAADRYERIDREQPAGARDIAAELAEARHEIALAERYARLLVLHEAGRWQAALAEASELLAARENGYRDTATRVEYLTARIAETAVRWPDAVSGYTACLGFADAPARLAHAHGHMLADLGDWQGAENQFRTANELDLDAHDLARYAAARVAEGVGDWAAALSRYAGLPDALLDVGARRSFVDGMLADARESWPGATTAFDALPDDFADGEVGLRRAFAVAKLAETRGEWGAVLTSLGATPDAFRNGSAGILRWTALGRGAEESDDWARAAECYASVAGNSVGTEEIDLALGYATGRRSEHDGDYSAARDAYESLPRDHRDVRQRIGYVTACAAELALDWTCAADLFAALPVDFEDAPTRSRYAEVRAAVAERRWPAAAAAADALGGHLDAAAIAAYARGRIAEEEADWAGAIVAYESYGEHADAAGRASYARARLLEAAGHWSRAKDAYVRAVAIHPDVRARLDRLDLLLTQLPFAESLAEATLVADPVALREAACPYPALNSAGITPASPTTMVANAVFALMERGAISWRERLAWHRLRPSARRLLVDAWMYRPREPDALGQTLTTVDVTTEGSVLSRLCARLPADAPLLTLLAGDRAKATDLWRQRLTECPDDLRDAHSLGLTSFWHAQDLEATGAGEQAESVWRTALACLATLIVDDEFWTDWRTDRAACYGHPVTRADTRQVRVELGRQLIDVLTHHADRHAAAGRQRETDRYQELVLCFETELDAAQRLKEAGGLPLRGGGRLGGGPEYLRLVGLYQEFGEFVADRHRSGQGQLGPLRRAFSELSRSSTLLHRHRFGAALGALPMYDRLRRFELPADCAGPGGHDLDCAHCEEFRRLNPAYIYLPQRRVQLFRDAAAIAVCAHLSIARELLTARRVDAAMVELTSAIDMANTSLIAADARAGALQIVVRHVDALAESTGIDAAVQLVDKAISAFGDPSRPALTRKRASLVVDRHLSDGSAHRESGPHTELTRAVDELRRAIGLDPDPTEERCDLAERLVRFSDDLPRAPDRLAVLIEALHCVVDELDQVGPGGRLTTALDVVLDSVEAVLLAQLPVADGHAVIRSLSLSPAAGLSGAAKARALAEEAERRRAEGNPILHAHCLVRAVRADLADERHRVDLRTALENLLLRQRQGEQAGD